MISDLSGAYSVATMHVPEPDTERMEELIRKVIGRAYTTKDLGEFNSSDAVGSGKVEFQFLRSVFFPRLSVPTQGYNLSQV